METIFNSNIVVNNDSITNISKIFVQKFDVSMNDFQGQQLIVFFFDATTEIETSISENKNKDILLCHVKICLLPLMTGNS